MNLHENLNSMMLQFIESCDDCVAVMPSAVAAATFARLKTGKLDPHIEYATLEHLKGMGRKLLAKRFEPEGEDNPAYSDQGEMFNGNLQRRYPVPRKRGEDPTYKLLEHLSDAELDWNIARHGKIANSHTAHMDALAAYKQARRALGSAA